MEDKISNGENNKNITPTIQKPKKISLDKYRDLEGITLSRLSFGLWYIQNKKGLKFLVIALLFVINSFIWMPILITFGNYTMMGVNEDNKLLAAVYQQIPPVDHNQSIRMSAQPLRVGEVESMKVQGSRYDFIAEIENVNKSHWGEFKYWLTVDDEKFGPYENFILPQDKKYLTALGIELTTKGTNIKLDIEDIKWTRIDPHRYKEWKAKVAAHINFDVTNKAFTPAKSSNLSEKLNLSTVEFDIKNLSPYSYLSTDLVILLYYRNTVVSAYTYNLEYFLSEENRHINITWPGQISRVDDIVVMPEINVAGSNIYYLR